MQKMLLSASLVAILVFALAPLAKADDPVSAFNSSVDQGLLAPAADSLEAVASSSGALVAAEVAAAKFDSAAHGVARALGNMKNLSAAVEVMMNMPELKVKAVFSVLAVEDTVRAVELLKKMVGSGDIREVEEAAQLVRHVMGTLESSQVAALMDEMNRLMSVGDILKIREQILVWDSGSANSFMSAINSSRDSLGLTRIAPPDET